MVVVLKDFQDVLERYERRGSLKESEMQLNEVRKFSANSKK